MKANKSSGRRNHTIPRFYLRRFLTPGYVYRHGELKPRFVHNCSNVAVHKDYYGRKESELPYLDSINGLIERHCALPLKRLLNIRQNNDLNITIGDKTLLSHFFANLWTRNPIIIEEIRTRYVDFSKKRKELLGKMVEQKKKTNAKAADDWIKKGSPIKYDGKPTTLHKLNNEISRLAGKGGHLLTASGLYKNIKKIADYIKSMTFLLLIAPPGNHFVACDRPLILISSESGLPRTGWANSDAFGIIPLSPEIMLLMFYNEKKGIFTANINAQDVAETNAITMMYAEKEVYSLKVNDKVCSWMRSRKNPHKMNYRTISG